MNEELIYYLALSHIDGIGAITAAALRQRWGHLKTAFNAGRDALIAAGLSADKATAMTTFDWQALDATLEWAGQENHHLLCLRDPLYPPLLRDIYQPPLVLFIKGDPSVLSQPQLAIVGSRRPSPIGEENADRFADYLAEQGLVITSGLAQGIDAVVHKAALKHNRCGSTIAVSGCGLDRVYPAKHQDLAEKIVAQDGALISEFALKTPPRAENFPRRNRIISGLCRGVLVVEAGRQSGSLITAQYALEQGREVFAIPGSIHNPLARGCHALIRQGAKLVETAADITEELSLLKGEQAIQDTVTAESDLTLDASYQKLLDCIDDQCTAMDSIITRSHLSVEVVASMLLQLELRGLIQSVDGGYSRVR
ncbi:MAG: DNA-processing protein DprA [Pseudomonadota bacterium]